MPNGADPRARASSSGKRGGGASTAARPKSSGEIREEEWEKFVRDSVATHAGWLNQPITSLAKVSEQSPVWIGFYLALAALPVLLAAQASWIPHVVSPITLLIPIQNTLKSIALETKRGRGEAPDSAQWAMYWTLWCVISWTGGWVTVFRPGWRALWEIWRVVALIIMGGPWFGRVSLRSAGPSKELQEAEKREDAETKKSEKEAAKKREREAKSRPKAADAEPRGGATTSAKRQMVMFPNSGIFRYHDVPTASVGRE